MKKKAIAAFVILLFLLAYPYWEIRRAKTHVNLFFQQVSVGMPVEAAESLAKKLDLKIIRPGGSGSKPSKFIAWDGWAFARWFCSISYEKGKVVKKGILFLD